MRSPGWTRSVYERRAAWNRGRLTPHLPLTVTLTGVEAIPLATTRRLLDEPGNDWTRMTITITAFERSPDRGRGLARDMRVRWALEEVAQPYDVRLVSFSTMKESGHRALHPFCQIPTFEEDDLVLFESGAIVLHIAERHAGLLPADANARARAFAWMFAARNTAEPPIVEFGMAWLLESDKPWYEERRPVLEGRVYARLDELSSRLDDGDWLEGALSAGDLLMVTVPRRLAASGMVEGYPNLCAYVARGEARPAYKRAFEDQLAVFTANTPPG